MWPRDVEDDWRSHNEGSADYMGVIILMQMMYLDAVLVTLKKGKCEVKTHVEVLILCHSTRAAAWYISRLGSDVTPKRVRVETIPSNPSIGTRT